MPKNHKDFFKKKNEWSVIKDSLLGGYLPQYFQKLLTSGRPIYYVDCFAGKGRFDDNNPGSPIIALEALEKSINQSSSSQARESVETCFIELHHAEDLRKNLNTYNNAGLVTEIVSGRFEDNIRNKLQDKKGHNVFLYIDPYGIEALDSHLFDEFRTYGFKTFEMLINFNSFGFFRDACSAMRVNVPEDDKAFQGLDELVEYEPTEVNDSEQSQKLLSRIAGGDYWKAIVQDYRDKLIDGYQAEKRLSTEYKNRLKQEYTYVLDMPIRIKKENRPKYRMIHVCDHDDGCYLMAENMQRRKDELFINIQQNGQLSLFDQSPFMSTTVEGDWITEDTVARMVSEQVRKIQDKKRLRVFEADFCNENGVVCPFSMIHAVLEKMEKKGEIEIIRDPAKTKTGRASLFWEEKKGQSVIIRRLGV